MLIVQPVSWATATPSADLVWSMSKDGQTLSDHGVGPLSLLPADSDLWLVLPVLATSWHRVRTPKIAASRLKQALEGLLEDRLLTDPTLLHLSLQPAAAPGEPAWVCACDKTLLTHWLQLFEDARRPIGRIVPDQTPLATSEWVAFTTGEQAWWAHAGPRGVWSTPLQATAPVQMADASPLRAEPTCAAAAEQSAGRPVAPEPLARRLLRSTQTDWNLAQFDLKRSAHTRRSQQLMQAFRQVAYAPAWAATRWGLLALATVVVLGVGMAGWTERQALATKRHALEATLKQSFPHVTMVLNAPLQMQQEVDRLQRAHGSPSPADLDIFLTHFSTSSPDGIGLSAIQFNPTEVQVTLTGANEANLSTLREGLHRQGWQTRFTSPTLTATRAPAAPAAATPRP